MKRNSRHIPLSRNAERLFKEKGLIIPEPDEEISILDHPDFENASSVSVWYGNQIINLLNKGKRQPALSKLRALSQALDSWTKLYRLSVDTAEIQEIHKELEELKQTINRDKFKLLPVVGQNND